MANRMKLFSVVYIPMLAAFYAAVPAWMDRSVLTLLWLSMFVAGAVYGSLPKLMKSGWTVAHFWGTSCGIPLVAVGYLAGLSDEKAVVHFFQLFAVYAIAALFLVFVVRVFVHTRE